MMIVVQAMNKDLRVNVERRSTMDRSPLRTDSPGDQPAPRLTLMSEKRDSLPV
jgi:hypothetical protein